MKNYRQIVALSLAGALALGPTSALFAADAPSTGAPDRELTLVNIKYQGKILWLPSPIIAKKGERVKLTLINNVPDDPAVHGFTIPAFGVKADVEREKPATVEFTAGKAGLFDTSCHLHPAHLHGQLLVLDE